MYKVLNNCPINFWNEKNIFKIVKSQNRIFILAKTYSWESFSVTTLFSNESTFFTLSKTYSEISRVSKL